MEADFFEEVEDETEDTLKSIPLEYHGTLPPPLPPLKNYMIFLQNINNTL